MIIIVIILLNDNLLLCMQSNDASFKGLLSSVVDTSCWEEAKQMAQNHKSKLEVQLAELGILAQQCQKSIERAAADLAWQQQQQQAWEQQQQQRRVCGWYIRGFIGFVVVCKIDYIVKLFPGITSTKPYTLVVAWN